jgi:hypothetical protein
VQEIAGKKSNWSYSSITAGGTTLGVRDVSKFRSQYPEREFKYDVRDMLEQIHVKTTKSFTV